MKLLDLTIPLGIGTPPWPTYEPLQVKYFKRLAPNGANGQVVTHSNHVGTHLDGEIHFYTPGKDIASLDMDFLVHEGVIVDLSDCTTDYDIYTSKQVEERVEVKVTYQRKKNWKTSASWQGSFYDYNDSSKDKRRYYVKLSGEKLFLEGDLVLSLGFKYRYTDYDKKNDSEQEAVRVAFRYKF